MILSIQVLRGLSILMYFLTYGLSTVSRKWLEVSAGNRLKEILHGMRASARELRADRS